MAAVEAERTRAFAAARNAEIAASMAAAEAQRTLRQALLSSKPSQLETGAISLPEHLGTAPAVKRETRYFEPCREAGRLTSPLQFTDGSTQIEQDMMPELDRIAMMAKACPAIRIEIHGHSDNSASAKVIRYLAERRAQAAVGYLTGLGIDEYRLAAIGHAETQPLAPNKTAENRARNRRIEIKIHDPAVEAAAQRVMWELADLLDPTYVPPLARLSP
jgi:outer membrane protein OmpA-like peptidoglycan-associated protein